MAARKQRQREQTGPGWVSTLGGAALLLLVGFGVGLLAGVAWEEPDLVMDHLAGRTTELSLVAETSTDPVEAEVQEPSDRPLGTRGSSPTASPSRASADPPSVSAPPPSPRPAPPARRPAAPEKDGFAIQVGAFGEEAAAARLAGELRAHGFSVYVRRGDGPGGARFRVRVGPVPGREDAVHLARKLKSDHQLPTWILSHDSP
jgi:cell division septation protein DedD